MGQRVNAFHSQWTISVESWDKHSSLQRQARRSWVLFNQDTSISTVSFLSVLIWSILMIDLFLLVIILLRLQFLLALRSAKIAFITLMQVTITNMHVILFSYWLIPLPPLLVVIQHAWWLVTWFPSPIIFLIMRYICIIIALVLHLYLSCRPQHFIFWFLVHLYY